MAESINSKGTCSIIVDVLPLPTVPPTEQVTIPMTGPSELSTEAITIMIISSTVAIVLLFVLVTVALVCHWQKKSLNDRIQQLTRPNFDSRQQQSSNIFDPRRKNWQLARPLPEPFDPIGKDGYSESVSDYPSRYEQFLRENPDAYEWQETHSSPDVFQDYLEIGLPEPDYL
uniref:Uncharacterized protein LOC102806352 n=1 Tax=Saccoglossus kowalevskii TaxID=10224 RepID=A0ABM0N0C9_SACKO|nr:PREDICTED: uncharacterized protein LOC102806352 [Saccoglossus kowalevskii]